MQIVKAFTELQNAHVHLNQRTDKTMKTDTVLALDYYILSEFGIKQLTPEIYQKLGADGGAGLKQVLGNVDDDTCLRVLKNAASFAANWGRKFEQVTEARSLRDIDLPMILASEGAALTEIIFDLRNEWGFANDARSVANRDRADFFRNPFGRPDQLLQHLLANNAQELRRVMNVATEKDLREALHRLSPESGGNLQSASADSVSLRDLLNLGDRKLLNQIFGLSQTRRLNFEPQFYA